MTEKISGALYHLRIDVTIQGGGHCWKCNRVESAAESREAILSRPLNVSTLTERDDDGPGVIAERDASGGVPESRATGGG